MSKITREEFAEQLLVSMLENFDNIKEEYKEQVSTLYAVRLCFMFTTNADNEYEAKELAEKEFEELRNDYGAFVEDVWKI